MGPSTHPIKVSVDREPCPAIILDLDQRDLWFKVINLETRKKRCRQELKWVLERNQDICSTLKELLDENPNAANTRSYKEYLAEWNMNDKFRRAVARMIRELQVEQEYSVAKLSRFQQHMFSKHTILDYVNRQDELWIEELRKEKYKSYANTNPDWEGLTPAFKEDMDEICKKDKEDMMWDFSFPEVSKPPELPLSPPNSSETVKREK